MSTQVSHTPLPSQHVLAEHQQLVDNRTRPGNDNMALVYTVLLLIYQFTYCCFCCFAVFVIFIVFAVCTVFLLYFAFLSLIVLVDGGV